MDERAAQVKNFREQLNELLSQKHKKLDELNRLARKVFSTFPSLFPKLTVSTKGCKCVYHPNVPNCHPISLEKEHGSREHLPHRYAKLALNGIEDLLIYIESQLK